MCDSKKSKFIIEQEAGRLLSSLLLIKPLSKIPLLSFFFVLEVLTS